MLALDFVARALDGFSAGGFSINADGQAPVNGYMVALQGHEWIVPPTGDLAQAIVSYVNGLNGHLDADTSLYLGGWAHNGDFYLDISECIVDYADAMRLAGERRQLAIWDVVNACEIEVS